MSKAAVVCSVAAAGVFFSLREAPTVEIASPQVILHDNVEGLHPGNEEVLEKQQYTKVVKERPMLLGKCVDLNHASKSALMDLPRIGPKLADRIIHYRSHQHVFKRLRDIKRVKGIGKATFAKIKPYVCIRK